MSLTRNRPSTIPATLNLIIQGEKISFDVTYHNRKLSELKETLKDAADASVPLLYVVKEWDSEYPLTKEGVLEAEDEMPGFILSVMGGFHEARAVGKAKN